VPVFAEHYLALALALHEHGLLDAHGGVGTLQTTATPR
jgi:hypothetical protein